MRRKIILDLGNGNSHHNDSNIICQSIDEVCRLQDKTDKLQFIVKTQLWSDNNTIVSKQLKSTSWEVFSRGYEHAMKRGLWFTTSVFDKESLDRLTCEYMVPFAKIANRPELYHLIDGSDIKFAVSVGNKEDYEMVLNKGHIPLLCVSKYPATIQQYIWLFDTIPDVDYIDYAIRGLSDHTIGFDLYNYANPYVYECHACLDRKQINDKIGGSDFVKTFKEIEEIII